MKKLLVTMALVCSALCAFGQHYGPRVHHAPMHYHHHHSYWGHAGSHFWPGFTAGIVGGIIGTTIARPTYVAPAPVVVQQPVVAAPVVVQQPVATQVITTPIVVR